MIGGQFLVFVGVGVVTALVDIGTMEGLITLGMHYGFAVSVGFAVGFIVNYCCHARVTFRAPSSVATVVKFGSVVFINYLLTLAFVVGSEHWWGSVLLGKIASLPVVAVNGFLWSKHWVFK